MVGPVTGADGEAYSSLAASMSARWRGGAASRSRAERRAAPARCGIVGRVHRPRVEVFLSHGRKITPPRLAGEGWVGSSQP